VTSMTPRSPTSLQRMMGRYVKGALMAAFLLKCIQIPTIFF
jgi:hypothetical protein